MPTITLNMEDPGATAPNSSTFLTFKLDTLTLPPGATVTGIRADVMYAASGPNNLGDFSLNSGRTFVVDFICYFAPTDSGTNTTLVADGDLHEANLVQSFHDPGGDALTTLEAGGYFGAKVDGATAGDLQVTFCAVYVDYTLPPTSGQNIPIGNVLAPLRVWPRSDMHASTPRLRGSRSRQGSNRLNGYL